MNVKLGNARLLKLADILDAIPPRKKDKDGLPKFVMDRFRHECGSPACALGWWAATNRRRWTLDFSGPSLKESHGSSFQDARAEFGLDGSEPYELFGTHGCGDAKTGKQAARYIRKFVEKRTANSSDEQRT